jgi:hypothetical protein
MGHNPLIRTASEGARVTLTADFEIYRGPGDDLLAGDGIV